jgi:hypothetical protein
VVGRNRNGLVYRNKNHIEKDNAYDNLMELDLNNTGDDIGDYTGNYNKLVCNNKDVDLDWMM